MREYRFHRGGVYSRYSTVMLVFVSLVFIWIPVSEWLRQERFEVSDLVPGLMLLFLWIVRLRPVKSVKISDTGTVEFVRGLGRVEVQVHDIDRIYPFFNLSRRNFFLRHSRGVEYLFEDPTLVAVMAAALVDLNPNIELLSVPNPPGRVDIGEE